MNSEQFAQNATTLLTVFGKTAHTAIGMYRDGGQRLASVIGGRWDAAFEQASPKLSPETRKNALHAQQVFGRCYTQGLTVSAEGAKVVVDTLVGAAVAGVERAASMKASRTR